MRDKTRKYGAEVQWIEWLRVPRNTEVAPSLSSLVEASLLVHDGEVGNSSLPFLWMND